MTYRCCGCGCDWPDGERAYCDCPTDVLFGVDSDEYRQKSIWMDATRRTVKTSVLPASFWETQAPPPRPLWVEFPLKALDTLGNVPFAAGVLFGVITVLLGIHINLLVDGRADWLDGQIEYVRTSE